MVLGDVDFLKQMGMLSPDYQQPPVDSTFALSQ